MFESQEDPCPKETKQLDISSGCNDIKIVKDDLLQSIIEDDLISHTSTTASLNSTSLDSENDKYVSYYIPKRNGELRAIVDPSDIPVEEIYNFEPLEYRVPVPKTESPKDTRLMATSIMIVKTIHNHESQKLLRVLFDSGGTKTMIHRRALPAGVNPMLLKDKEEMTTLTGVYQSQGKVMLTRLRLPELDKNRIVDSQEALVFDSPC